MQYSEKRYKSEVYFCYPFYKSNVALFGPVTKNSSVQWEIQKTTSDIVNSLADYFESCNGNNMYMHNGAKLSYSY